MRMMTSWPARIAITLVLVGGSARSTSAQDWSQKHQPEELLALATAAYRTLPEVPSPADARPLLRALANLHAYAGVSPRVRTDQALADEIRTALEWLTSNLGNVLPAGTDAKADEAWLSPIERRGLAAYDSVRNRRTSLASPFRSYVAAVTNLYVVRQATTSPSSRSLDALGWLSANPVGIDAGFSAKADDPRTNSLPTRPKPDLFGATPNPAPKADLLDGRPNPAPKADLLDATPRPAPKPIVPDLSGPWRGNDGGIYDVRQTGTEVWWHGESADDGESWSNIFHGTLNPMTRTITGRWINVKGPARGGEIVLRYSDDSRDARTLNAVRQTGGFAGSLWRLCTRASPCER